MDLFTRSLPLPARPDVREKLLRERKQVIDGVNNLAYWTGASQGQRARTASSTTTSRRSPRALAQWKIHFATKEHY